MLLAQVLDVAAGGLEDPQAQQPQHRDQREVAAVRRGPGGGEQRLELQMSQSQSRGLGRHVRAADVLGGRVLQDVVNHTGAVEPRNHRDPT